MAFAGLWGSGFKMAATGWRAGSVFGRRVRAGRAARRLRFVCGRQGGDTPERGGRDVFPCSAVTPEWNGGIFHPYE